MIHEITDELRSNYRVTSYLVIQLGFLGSNLADGLAILGNTCNLVDKQKHCNVPVMIL